LFSGDLAALVRFAPFRTLHSAKTPKSRQQCVIPVSFPVPFRRKGLFRGFARQTQKDAFSVGQTLFSLASFYDCLTVVFRLPLPLTPAHSPARHPKKRFPQESHFFL
jgi:hypothetical protein